MLTQLRAYGFRNLEAVEWQPSPGLHLLLGGNGAGKTSLLEAVYLVATTRSFRTAQITDCVQHGMQGFHLEGEVETTSRVLLRMSCHGGVRERQVNRSTTSLSEYLAVLPIVSWTAQDSNLWVGAPDLRRRFLDRGVLALRPDALQYIGRYRKVLAHKRRILVTGSTGLKVWNEMLAPLAVQLMSLRWQYVEQVRAELKKIMEMDLFGIPEIRLKYRPSLQGSADAEYIALELRRIEKKELEKGRPLAGPHLDDLEISWGDHRLRRVASAGERKMVGLILLVAHGRVLQSLQRSPLFLLDDIDTELSMETLKKIWPLFVDAPQLVATSNRPDVWKGISFDSRWQLEKGRFIAL